MADEPGKDFTEVDLTGARFRKVRLGGARFRDVDLTGVQIRDASLADGEIDGVITGLTINGVEVAPLIADELARREPERAFRTATTPADLLSAWTAVQERWAQTYERVAGLPAGTVDVSVDDEWSFAQTLRHLVMATDAWLGAVRGDGRPFHRIGLPFSDAADYVDVAALGIDVDAAPSYDEVLAVRAGRVAEVRDYLTSATEADLAVEVVGPWGQDPVSRLRCLRVIFNEELEHHRFARRDLDAIEARS